MFSDQDICNPLPIGIGIIVVARSLRVLSDHALDVRAQDPSDLLPRLVSRDVPRRRKVGALARRTHGVDHHTAFVLENAAFLEEPGRIVVPLGAALGYLFVGCATDHQEGHDRNQTQGYP